MSGKSMSIDIDNINIIEQKVERIESIKKNNGLSNTALKNKILSGMESIIDNIKSENDQDKQTIKDNSGLVNSVKRLFMELSNIFSGRSSQAKKNNDINSYGKNLTALNNQLVDIAALNRENNIENTEIQRNSVFEKFNDNGKNIMAVENNKDDIKMSR